VRGALATNGEVWRRGKAEIEKNNILKNKKQI
jgi:hypothetical protein